MKVDAAIVFTSMHSCRAGYIDSAQKFCWYEHNKTFRWCPIGKKPTMPNCDSHITNTSVDMQVQQSVDRCYQISPCSHSTDSTQQADQRGGPIQHMKAWMCVFLRLIRRSHGNLKNRAHVCRAIQLAVSLSHTPEICSRAALMVGWSIRASRPGLNRVPTNGETFLNYSPLFIQAIFMRTKGRPNNAAQAKSIRKELEAKRGLDRENQCLHKFMASEEAKKNQQMINALFAMSGVLQGEEDVLPKGIKKHKPTPKNTRQGALSGADDFQRVTLERQMQELQDMKADVKRRCKAYSANLKYHTLAHDCTRMLLVKELPNQLQMKAFLIIRNPALLEQGTPKPWSTDSGKKSGRSKCARTCFAFVFPSLKTPPFLQTWASLPSTTLTLRRRLRRRPSPSLLRIRLRPSCRSSGKQLSSGSRARDLRSRA